MTSTKEMWRGGSLSALRGVHQWPRQVTCEVDRGKHQWEEAVSPTCSMWNSIFAAYSATHHFLHGRTIQTYAMDHSPLAASCYLNPKHSKVDAIRNQGGYRSISSKSFLTLFASFSSWWRILKFLLQVKKAFLVCYRHSQKCLIQKEIQFCPQLSHHFALFVILVVHQLCPFVPLIARDIFILSKLYQALCKMNQFGKSMSCTVVLSVH